MPSQEEIEQQEDDEQQLREILRAQQRRLRVLEIQQARKGDNTPPEVIIEIEDIQADIRTVEAQLESIKQKRFEESLYKTWHKCFGPYTVAVFCLTTDSLDPNIVYAGAALGQGAFKSTDGGTTWQKMNLDNIKEVNEIAVSYSNSNILYAATSRGLYQSLDQGLSWRPYAAFESKETRSIVLSRDDPKFMAVGTVEQTGGGIMQTSGLGVSSSSAHEITKTSGDINSGGLHIASDSGVTTIPIKDILQLITDPQDSKVIYAATNNLGVYRSIDSGVTWRRVFLLKGGRSSAVWRVGISLHDRDFILIGTAEDGLYMSSDGGLTYSPVPFFSEQGINAIIYSGDTIYVGTDQGIFRSTDNGTHWISDNENIIHKRIRSIAITSDQTMYVGTDAGGIYRRHAAELSWKCVFPGIQPPSILSITTIDGRPCVGTTAGVYISDDEYGNTWSAVFGSARIWSIAALKPSLTDDHESGVFISRDTGGTWMQQDASFVTSYTIYAGLEYGSIIKSLITSNNWNAISSFPGTKKIYSIAVASRSNYIYAISYNEGVFLSKNRGGNWLEINNGLSNLKVTSIFLSVHDEEIMFTGTTNGIYRSLDGGGSWTYGQNDIDKPVFSIAQSYQRRDILFVASDGKGVFRTTDEGQSWKECNRGLENLQVLAVALSPMDDNIVLVGTRDGIYRSNNGGLQWEHFNSGIEKDNPVNRLFISSDNPNFVYAGTMLGLFLIKLA